MSARTTGQYRRPGGHAATHVRPAAWLAAALVLLAGGPRSLAAQYPDARVLPRGVLRASFEPRFISYDRRFGPDGRVEPLGLDLSADSAGPTIIPSLAGPENAVRSIIGDDTYRISAGAFRTELDADIRRLPFNFAFGLTERLTLTLSVPLVTTRIQVGFAVDSANANTGWNPATGLTGDPGALGQIQTLLSELEAGATQIEADMMGGAFGCPGSAQCDAAQAAVDRARRLSSDLTLMTGVAGMAPLTNAPPFVPLASSTAGQAVLAAIQDVSTELQTFGATALTATLPLPEARLGTEEVQSIFENPVFGYNSFPLAFAKLTSRLGDLEIGARWGAVQQPNLRTTLTGVLRLPTGTRDSPDHFLDIGTGDQQFDVEVGFETVWQPGTVLALAAFGRYTLQLRDSRARRIAPPDRPIALEAAEATVERNLGDVIELGAFPTLRLTEGLRVYLSARYRHKRADRFALPPGSGFEPTFPGAVGVETLELETEQRTLHFGGGLHFRGTRRGDDPGLPIEAGIDFRSALDGSGGLTPKSRNLNFYLRFFFQLLGEKEGEG